ncbi:MAG: peptide chain release factor N(5)-glutamine methyltransferase [Kiritimatiellae bacterium]|nr:peptide chain release factor N(5)-glutamine methyltransferase [Kiritimatiellia bacterium]
MAENHGKQTVWKDVIRLAADYLERQNVPDSQIAAELLAARLLKCGRGFLVSSMDKVVPEPHLEAMRRGMVRLANGEPVQHVLGEWDFRKLTLKCDRRALIPRPETEDLVERVLKHLRTVYGDNGTEAPFVVDVGTGSGCIILSLAKEFGKGVFLGTDISAEAITLARENAAKCGLDGIVKLAVADGLDEFDPESVDVIVSNPPYITTADCETLDPRVKDYEPRSALDGGVSGLDFYERFIGDAMNVLKPGGALFCEIGDGQGEALKGLFESYGFTDIKIEKDFSGHDRYASGRL